MSLLVFVLLLCAPAFGMMCNRGPCLNGGIAETDPSGVCKCTCQRGYAGTACEIANATLSNYDVCYGTVCYNGGFPVPGSSVLGGCRCACPTGYGGPKCQTAGTCLLYANCLPCDPCLFGSLSLLDCQCHCDNSYAYGYLCDKQQYCSQNTDCTSCIYDQSAGGCAWWSPVKIDGTCSSLPPICAWSSFHKVYTYSACDVC